MSRGCAGKRFACKLQIGQSAKPNRREIVLYGTRPANTFSSGAGCGGNASCSKLQVGRIPSRESLTPLPPGPNGGGPEPPGLWAEVPRA